MTGLMATTTALAAASVLPVPAAHVVDKALHQVGINVAPPASPRSHTVGATPPVTVPVPAVTRAVPPVGADSPTAAAGCRWRGRIGERIRRHGVDRIGILH